MTTPINNSPNFDLTDQLKRIQEADTKSISISDFLEVVGSTQVEAKAIIFALRAFDANLLFSINQDIQVNASSLYSNIQKSVSELREFTGYNPNTLDSNRDSAKLAKTELGINQDRISNQPIDIDTYNARAEAFNNQLPTINAERTAQGLTAHSPLPIISSPPSLDALSDLPKEPDQTTPDNFNVYIVDYNAVYAANQQVIDNHNEVYLKMAEYNGRLEFANSVLGAGPFTPFPETNPLIPPGPFYVGERALNNDGTSRTPPPLSAPLISMEPVDTSLLSSSKVTRNDQRETELNSAINTANTKIAGYAAFRTNYLAMRTQFNNNRAAINAALSDGQLSLINSNLPNVSLPAGNLSAPTSISYPESIPTLAEFDAFNDSITAYNDAAEVQESKVKDYNTAIEKMNAEIRFVEDHRALITKLGLTINTVAEQETLTLEYKPLEHFYVTHGYLTPEWDRAVDDDAEATNVKLTTEEALAKMDANNFDKINTSIEDFNAVLDSGTITFIENGTNLTKINAGITDANNRALRRLEPTALSSRVSAKNSINTAHNNAVSPNNTLRGRIATYNNIRNHFWFGWWERSGAAYYETNYPEMDWRTVNRPPSITSPASYSSLPAIDLNNADLTAATPAAITAANTEINGFNSKINSNINKKNTNNTRRNSYNTNTPLLQVAKQDIDHNLVLAYGIINQTYTSSIPNAPAALPTALTYPSSSIASFVNGPPDVSITPLSTGDNQPLPAPPTGTIDLMNSIEDAKREVLLEEITEINAIITEYNATPETENFPLVTPVSGATAAELEALIIGVAGSAATETAEATTGTFPDQDLMPAFSPITPNEIQTQLESNGLVITNYNNKVSEYNVWVEKYNTLVDVLNGPNVQGKFSTAHNFTPLPKMARLLDSNPKLPPYPVRLNQTPAGIALLENLSNARSATANLVAGILNVARLIIEEAEEDSTTELQKAGRRSIKLAQSGTIEIGAPGALGFYLEGVALDSSAFSTVFNSAFNRDIIRNALLAIGVPTTISGINFTRVGDSPDGVAAGSTTISFTELETLSTTLVLALLDQIGPLSTRTTVSLINAILQGADLNDESLAIFSALVDLENILATLSSGTMEDALRKLLEQQFAGLTEAQLDALVQAVLPTVQVPLLNVALGQLSATIGDPTVVPNAIARVVDELTKDPSRHLDEVIREIEKDPSSHLDEVIREIEKEFRPSIEQKIKDDFGDLLSEEEREQIVDRIFSALLGPAPLISLPTVEGLTPAEIENEEIKRFVTKLDVRREADMTIPSAAMMVMHVHFGIKDDAEKVKDKGIAAIQSVVIKDSEKIKEKTFEEETEKLAESLILTTSWFEKSLYLMVPAHRLSIIGGAVWGVPPTGSDTDPVNNAIINQITSGPA
ncbi:hypothetical protein SCG7086_AV_00050 [Chlamydiales bacterium SCGC AG-110-P3]|nr:hypothetical protein SCG7086_AV_00050 [Chlamydiales bacterium SCGC AG-110-P3]